MKKKALILIVFLCFINSLCFSYDKDKHSEILRDVLFGTNSTITFNDKEQIKFDLLDFSSRIAIDQYNNHYITELKSLKSNRIKTVSSINEIDFTSNSHHQRYTHRGWNFTYPKDEANWPLRKKLMLETTGKIFSFDSNEQHDAFTALIYYIHILGDHDWDSISNAMERIALGGRSDKLDILDELANIYLPKLFKNQKSEVNNLCEKLLAINYKCSILLRRKGEEYDERNVKRDVSELTAEEYRIYQKYANEALYELEKKMPILLKNEKWFTKAFPSSK